MPRDGRVSWFGIVLAVLLFLGTLGPFFDFVDTYPQATESGLLSKREHMRIGSIPHDLIVIDGDANFSSTASAEGWLGDGSSGNPYIINSLTIDRGGAAGHCTNISNTRAYFIIQNCNLTGASADAGIYLYNVSHGLLKNNTCNLNRYGIYLLDSNSNTIANNTCTQNIDRGLYMYNSDFNIVSDNDFSDNVNYAILLYYCDSSLFYRNLCSSNGYEGIHARYATFNTFENNTCDTNGNDGIRIWYYSHANNLYNNSCSNNGNFGILCDGGGYPEIPIISNNTCSGNEIGIYVSGSFLNVAKNILTDNEYRGMEVSGCDESTITHNLVKGSYEGIWLSHTTYTILSQNDISGADWGVWLEESSENMISENSFTQVVQYGIVVDYNSHMNTILLNEISVDDFASFDQFTGIYLSGTSSENNVTLNYILHDNGFPDSESIHDDYTGSGGNIIDRNWYQDYQGGGPYSIPGDAGNSDLHPISYPPFAPTWVEIPANQVLDYWSQPFYYDLNATAPSPITWLVNDTSHFAISNDGLIQSITELPVGMYGLMVKVTNLYGIFITSSFQLSVQEVSQPEWIVSPTDLSFNYGERFEYGLIATDESGIVEWAINDTVNFSLSSTRLNVTGYHNGWQLLQITNATTLLTDVYPLNVTVVDAYGNALTGIFTVTVEPPDEDVTAPIWIVSPMNEVLEYGESFEQRLGAWDISGVSIWWLNETTHFAIDEYGVIRNATIVEPGIYRLEVRAYDPYDNYCSGTLVVTVNEVADTPTTTTPNIHTTPPTTDTTISTSQSSQEIMTAVAIFMFLAGISGAAVIVTIIVLLRRTT
ncbi:MAG: right-handed parallel beta-helix repeat-containing protein [Candidatus Thorarchaeota archaeon]